MSKQALTEEEKKFDDEIRELGRNFCIVKTVTNRTEYTLYKSSDVNALNSFSILEVYDDFEKFKQEVLNYFKNLIWSDYKAEFKVLTKKTINYIVLTDKKQKTRDYTIKQLYFFCFFDCKKKIKQFFY